MLEVTFAISCRYVLMLVIEIKYHTLLSFFTGNALRLMIC